MDLLLSIIKQIGKLFTSRKPPFDFSNPNTRQKFRLMPTKFIIKSKNFKWTIK